MNESKENILFLFDDFCIDPRERSLKRGDETISITAKAFDTLLVLVSRGGRLVGKNELLDVVWQDTFVEESTLAQNISTLRKAFSSAGSEKQYIETVPRKGYRFIGEVRRTDRSDDDYIIETRTKTRVVAEHTEITRSEPDANTIRRNFLGALFSRKKLIALAGLLLTALAGYFIYLRFTQPRDAFSAISSQEIMTVGDIKAAAVSPNGQFIAIVETRSGEENLRIRQTAGSRDVEILPFSDIAFQGIAFSADSSTIYYSVYRNERTKGNTLRIGKLYSVPALGGPSRELASDVDSSPAPSKDGSQIVFIRNIPGLQQTNLVSFDLAVGNEHIIVQRSGKERFTLEPPSISPDGKWIAAAAFSERDPLRAIDVMIVNTVSGEQRPLCEHPFVWAGATAWTSDSDSVLFTAYSPDSPNITDEIWIASLKNNTAMKIAGGINGVLGLSASADAKKVLVVRTGRVSSLWVLSMIKGGPAVPVFKDIGDNSLSPLELDWLSNDKILYSSAANGQSDVWALDIGSGASLRLTDWPSGEFGPVRGPDGQTIFFRSNKDGIPSIWSMRLNGTDAKKISGLLDQSAPSLSGDGKFIYFSGRTSIDLPLSLWRASVNGKDPQKLTENSAAAPQISPSGDLVAVFYPLQNFIGAGRPPLVATILSIDGRTVIKQFPDLRFSENPSIYWTPDSKAFTFIRTEKNVSNIWKQGLDDDPPQQITKFDTDIIFRYRFSPDGSYLAFEKGFTKNDIVMITDER